MLIRAALLAFLIAGCAGPSSRAALTWEFRAADREGYTRVTQKGLAPLIRRAETDFGASPAFQRERPMLLELLGAARHRDGRTLIAFSMGGASDMAAVYVFDRHGEIIDRYLHSFWGVIPNRRPTNRR